MDSFDDLLAPSRHFLEENPFADPFAKRSNSPDPWASPFAINQAGSKEHGSTSTTTDPPSEEIRHGISSHESAEESNTSYIKDPLDSEFLAHSGEHDSSAIGQSHIRGFKESVEPDSQFSETATIRPTNNVNVVEVSAANEAQSHIAEREAATPETLHPPDNALSPSSSIRDVGFTSPLQSPSTMGIERSIANLSVGGEPSGGWMNEQTAWGGESTSFVAAKPPVEDDSDDDKPIRQTFRTNTQEDKFDEAKGNQIQPLFVISVEDPQKVGDHIRPYIMYTVHTRTTSPTFQRASFSVLRRYSDFLWLYETLCVNNPGVVVPPVPEKSALNRFDEQFVRQRRLGLEKCVQKVANHPVLCKDSDLRLFLESDTFALDIKHRKAELAHERGGIMASIGQSITGHRFHETDEWFDRQRSYLDGLESQLRGLVKAVEQLAKQRQELAVAASDFAQSVADLAEAGVGEHLSAALAGLGDMEKKYQELQNSQSEQDMATFLSTADEYTRLIGSVRSAFGSRVRVYHSWKSSESDLLRIKQAHERDRAQGRISSDRLAYSLSRIAEAERRAVEAKQEYEHVSKLVKSEMGRFERERVEDFKETLKTFLEGMISRQAQLISNWEGYQQTLLKSVGDSNAVQSTGVTS
ncbi:hypothetical protein APHAL10511_004276 [Amanita phalloides]|nr:hypothetical protein APHAL10511_004276 [Amanita phalloides]